MQKTQENPKDALRQRILTIIKDIRTDYMEFLRCLKFYNKAEQEQLGVQKRGRHFRGVPEFAREISDGDYDSPLDDQYNYILELSKENKMEIAMIKLMEGISKLQDLHADIREYAMINLEHQIQVQNIVQSINKVVELKRKAGP